MKYLISTTDQRGAAEIETRLRLMGSITARQRLQAFPSKTIPGALDICLLDNNDEQPQQQKKRR